MGQQEEHLIDSSKKSSLEKNVVCVCEDVLAAGFAQENQEQNSTQN